MSGTNTKIPSLVEQLKRELDFAQAENDALTTKNEQLNAGIRDAEERERVATERASEAERNRATLEELTAASYKEVVKQLFEEPSRHATRQTIRWAAVSIGVGILATLWSSLYSARMSSTSATQLSEAIDARLASRIEDNHNKIAAELHGTEQRVKALMERSAPSRPTRLVLLENHCSQTINVAVHYMNSDFQWTTIGWFVVPPGAAKNTTIRASGDIIYFYAKSSNGLVWSATGLEKQLSVNVTVDEHDRFNSASPQLARPQVVPFFGQVFGNNPEIISTFVCG